MGGWGGRGVNREGWVSGECGRVGGGWGRVGDKLGRGKGG